MDEPKRNFSVFDLDQNRLDEEWLEQPKMMYQATLDWADACAGRDRAEAEKDVVAAEVLMAVRRAPNEFGIHTEKPTEAMVAAAVTLDKRHKKAVEDAIVAEHAVKVAKAGVDALDHRKKSLEGRVQLFAMGYFGEPKAPKGTAEQIGLMERQAAFGSSKRQGVRNKS